LIDDDDDDAPSQREKVNINLSSMTNTFVAWKIDEGSASREYSGLVPHDVLCFSLIFKLLLSHWKTIHTGTRGGLSRTDGFVSIEKGNISRRHTANVGAM
jgi:hypothetical protein